MESFAVFSDPAQLIKLLFLLLASIPIMGGSVGMLISALVNVVKVVAMIIGKPLADDVAGRLVVIFNTLSVIVLFAILGRAPGANEALPQNVDVVVQAAVLVFSGLATILTSFAAARLAHSQTKKLVPSLVSGTYRAQSAQPPWNPPGKKPLG